MNISSILAVSLIIPLAGFLLNLLFGNKISKGLVGIIGCGSILVALIMNIMLFSHALSGPETVTYFNWIHAGNFTVDMAFLVDRLSVLMLLIITGVGFLIHMYSVGYMHDDEAYFRYFSYLNLFVFFMQMLVLGANYLITFIGWEGVGLCSYLLIGFWYKNTGYNNAAKKAFIMNRIGDLGFLIGIFWIFNQFGSINFKEVFAGAQGFIRNNNYNDTVMIFITVLLFVGAVGKSAQIPLYTWLPDAMAGPTPVSALIHAATMVTAGIYVIVRSHVLYSLAPFTQELIAIVGISTAFFAATIGLAQNDIKKVLAYSTVSQLGYMFAALGVGAYGSGMFHLMTHAFFKALLFLGAGSVIHAMGGEQDMRSMGGLRKKLPITFITVLTGTLAISGLPPFAGFFSKDEILAKIYEQNPVIWAVGLITAGITALYMFRMLFLTFFGEFRGDAHQESHLHESPPSMTIPLIVLAILSLIGGFVGIPEIFGGKHILNEYFSPIFSDLAGIPVKGTPLDHSMEFILMGISVALVLVAIFFASRFYIRKTAEGMEDEKQGGFVKVLAHKYYVDELYDTIIVKPADWFSGIIYRFLELGFIDGIVNGTGRAATVTGKTVRKLQTGHIGFYLFAMVAGVIILILLNSIFIS
jgi:NADH-quinone oxidoreductase subunit L